MADKVFASLGASNHSAEERQKEEYYSTDPIFINHLLEVEPWLKNPDLKILEPAAGECALVDRFFELTGNKMDAYDLIKRREDVIEQDYFDMDFSDKYDVILTNPPYIRDTSKSTRGLSDFIVKNLKEVKIGGSVILLLKTLHLESKMRYDKIYKNCPPSKIYVYTKRITCYKDGLSENKTTGAVSYSIFIWKNKKEDGSFDKGTILDWINTGE